MSNAIETVEGTFTLNNGRKVEFQITPDLNYGQWGADTLTLGAMVDVLEALRDAVAEQRLDYAEGDGFE